MVGKKILIFDLDGVLFDGTKMHKEIFIDTLSKHGLSQFGNDPIIDTALSSRQKIKHIAQENHLTLDIEQFLKDKNKLTEPTINKLDIYDRQKYELIRDLRFEGHKIALATNTHKQNAIFILAKMDIIHFFNTIISGYQVENPKPSPDIIFKIYEELELTEEEKQNAILFEDSDEGIETGKNAGCKTVKVNSIDEVTYNFVLSHL